MPENDAQEIRYHLLRMLSAEPDLTQRQMAQKLGVSLGKLNFYLTQLIRKGLVEMKKVISSQSRSKIYYFITPCGIEEKATVALRYLKNKQREYERIKRQISELYEEIERDRQGVVQGAAGMEP